MTDDLTECRDRPPATPAPATGPAGALQGSPTRAASGDEDMDDTIMAPCWEDDRCNENCIRTAAAIECSLACADQQNACSGDADGDLGDEKTLDGGGVDEHEHRDTCTVSPTQAQIQAHTRTRTRTHGATDEQKGPHLYHLDAAHQHAHAADGTHLDEPCILHLRAAMDKYARYLESAGCICRSILASLVRIDSCHPPAPSAAEGGCSGGGSHMGDHSGTASVTSAVAHDLSMKEYGSGVSCQPFLRAAPEYLAAPAEKKCCDSRCDSHESLPGIPVDRARPTTHGASAVDVEQAAGLSRALLHVTGMDCSGCANNLARALRAVDGTRNVQVTFITSMAEVELDPVVTPLDRVIRAAQRATGYTLTPFSSDTQTLVVNMSASAAGHFCANLPRGVERCDKIAPAMYEISYDPCVVGARDLLATLDGQLGPLRGDPTLDHGRRRLRRVAALTATAFILTVPVVVLEWGRPSALSERTALVVAVVLATLVQAIAVPEFYVPAVSSLVYNKVVEMDMLVVISITAAYAYSIVAAALVFAGRDGQTKPLFETSTLLTSLILLGRLLAAWARRRAIQAVSVRSLQALTAALINPTTGAVTEMDARLLQYGDRIAIEPHTRIVTDAEVLVGTSEVDESMLTGESIPVFKTAGHAVTSGTVNGGGRLTARITRLPGRNTITDIADLVDHAQRCKPRVQDLADRVAGYFVPVICAVALGVFVIWVGVVLKVRLQSAGDAVRSALSYSIAVLAISCPCALGLAVPMVLVVAGGKAARGGVIIKTADVIQRAFQVTDVVFDKTGTLTEPRLQVVRELTFPTDHVDAATMLAVTAALVRGSKHPVSEAVTHALAARELRRVEVDGLVSIPGCGVEARWQGMTVRAGSARWLQISESPAVVWLAAHGLTMLGVTFGGHLAAMFGLKSRLRDGAPGVIRELCRRRIAVHIVSGDARRVVERVAADLDVPAQRVAAECSPAQKQAYLQRLMGAGKTTLFCGDGTNDAVAVAQADVGVQIESSSDVTRATADVVLLRNLDGVVDLLDVSRAAFRRIVFNFVWSVVYNVLAILLAAGALVKVRIPPAYAGLGEMVSVLPVIIAAITQPKVMARHA